MVTHKIFRFQHSPIRIKIILVGWGGVLSGTLARMERTPCGTLGCPNPPRLLLGHMKQRTLRRFCADCAPGMFATGKFLALVHPVAPEKP